MPSVSRMIVHNRTAIYHIMSRTALDGFPLEAFEKDFLLDLIKRMSALFFTEFYGFCFTQLNSLNKNVLHLCASE
jgi:putative transposase